MLEVKYYEHNNVILLKVFLRKSEKFITGEVLQRTGGGGEEEGLEIFFFQKKKKTSAGRGMVIQDQRILHWDWLNYGKLFNSMGILNKIAN